MKQFLRKISPEIKAVYLVLGLFPASLFPADLFPADFPRQVISPPGLFPYFFFLAIFFSNKEIYQTKSNQAKQN